MNSVCGGGITLPVIGWDSMKKLAKNPFSCKEIYDCVIKKKVNSDVRILFSEN